ncbi:hypothetical protein DFJ77DRAFT_547448 [Powellomyces hirtus]|nr:hypothetical protein DFJ77DRAFT_547448 [Powellomyces hirtus]
MSQLQQDISSFLTNIAALTIYANSLRVTDGEKYERVFQTTQEFDEAMPDTRAYWLTLLLLAAVELVAALAFCALLSLIRLLYMVWSKIRHQPAVKDQHEKVVAYTLSHSTAGIAVSTLLGILPLLGLHGRRPERTAIPTGMGRHLTTTIMKIVMVVILIQAFPKWVGLGYVGGAVGWTGVVAACVADIATSVTAESEAKGLGQVRLPSSPTV